jgi:hypothetical protein
VLLVPSRVYKWSINQSIVTRTRDNINDSELNNNKYLSNRMSIIDTVLNFSVKYLIWIFLYPCGDNNLRDEMNIA